MKSQTAVGFFLSKTTTNVENLPLSATRYIFVPVPECVLLFVILPTVATILQLKWHLFDKITPEGKKNVNKPKKIL